MLSEKLRILHLEDSETDAAHIHRVLKKGEINFDPLVVDSRADYIRALKDFEPHLVLSDHSMPAFNPEEALDILRTSGVDIPFILVTGAVSEEFAAQIMLKGADDYILKDRPKRLPSSIITALEKYNVRRAKEKHEGHLRNIFDGSTDILCSIDAYGRFIEVSAAAEKIWGYKPAELHGKKYMDLVFEADHRATRKAAEGVMAGVAVTNFENRCTSKNGSLVPVVWSARWDERAKIMYAIARDATEKKESEKKLEENFRQLQAAESLKTSILNSVPAQIALLNGEGVIIAVNKAWIDSGLSNNLKSKNNGVGENYIKVSANALGGSDTLGQKMAAGISEVIKGSVNEFTLEYPCHSAVEKRWFEARVSPTQHGDERGAVVMHTNITERKHDQDLISKSAANLSAIIESADAYVYSLDTELRYVSFNTRLSKSIKDFLGMDVREGEPIVKYLQKAGPVQTRFWLEKYEEVLAGKSLVFDMDYSRPGKPRYLSYSLNPIMEKEAIIGISCFCRNATESKLAEIEMKELAKRLQLATTSAGMGIWDWDITKDRLSFDKGMYKLYELEEGQFSSVYEGWISRLHPEDREITDNAIQMAIAGKKDYNTEFRIIAGNSSIHYIRATGIIERDERGVAVRMIGANWDITEKKEAELAIKKMNETLEKRVEERTAELMEAYKDLEAYTATVSHDLRAPTRAIASFAKIIREDYGSNMEPKEAELFGFIEDSATRMNAIIGDLLKLAKYGNEQLKPEPVNMTRFVEGIWLNISRLNPHNAELDLKELAEVKADKSTMQQVVVNLLTNAIKYSSKKEKPLVKIWSETNEEGVTFYFKDNGAGFDMKNYDRLFGAFQRLHNRKDFDGTGVGLTLVKRIIEKHGGTVGAEGKVGEGATFYFKLPAA